MFSANSSQVSDSKLFVEDVFSTWLYTGNGSTQTITNGIDLAGKGGLVWVKQRDLGRENVLYDTSRGASNALFSNLTNAQATNFGGVSAFNSTGFSLNSFASEANALNGTYASWTFREAPKFFDVVTWTGNDAAGRNISHNLGSVPGAIFLKATSTSGSWQVYHRSLGADQNLVLNTTQPAQGNGGIFPRVTSTSFGVDYGDQNASGVTYVAYVFAHDAGGFGASGTDSVISCGSFTANGGTVSVDLGWEPQWLLVKRADSTSSWFITDNMRGFSNGNTIRLQPNMSSAEGDEGAAYLVPTATGFNHNNYFASGANVIYIAIRRGPMRTPTLGTSVFSPDFFGGGTRYYNSGFPTDMAITNLRAGDSFNNYTIDRLRGGNNGLRTHSNAGESLDSAAMFDNMVGIGPAYTGGTNSGYIGWLFRRAPGFFDEVCYTGTGSARTLNHNLGVTPELMIVKRRDSAGSWYVYAASQGASSYGLLPESAGFQAAGASIWNSTNPTSSVFSIGTSTALNGGGGTYLAYLFASCPGVSKIGTYVGNGSSQTLNCGFAAGARFVLIKRTDSTGDWYVWDTTRGIVAGNDPHLSLNTASAEVTTDDSVDTDSSGFVVNQVSATDVNVSSATYIYLAIA